MKKIALSFAAVVALASVAHAEDDSCSVMTAGEGQKLACVQAKFQGKVAQVSKFATDIQSQIEKMEQQRDANDNDKQEREARLAQLRLALKGLMTEMEEAKTSALTVAHNVAQEVREVTGRAEDSDKDQAERAARMAKVKSVYDSIVAEIKETAKEILDGAKALLTRITTDDKD